MIYCIDGLVYIWAKMLSLMSAASYADHEHYRRPTSRWSKGDSVYGYLHSADLPAGQSWSSVFDCAPTNRRESLDHVQPSSESRSGVSAGRRVDGV